MAHDLSIRKDLTLTFGDSHDGVIGIPGITRDGHVIEISYFFGDAKPKNIIGISSQTGCPMSCAFCELGQESFARNLTPEEFREQVLLMLDEAARHGFHPDVTPHKVTVANTGEPLLNPGLIDGLELVAETLSASFKVSTVMPATRIAKETLARLADFSARCRHPVQLQISLISTSERQRQGMAGARLAGFGEIREAAETWRRKNPNGRKINVSLILTSGMAADVDDVFNRLPPDLFRFRFRDYVPTAHGESNGLAVIQSSRLSDIKDRFRERGYDAGDWASPTPTEWRFGLAGNVIRRMYLEMTKRAR